MDQLIRKLKNLKEEWGIPKSRRKRNPEYLAGHGKGEWNMEIKSSLKEHLRQLEEKLLKPEIRNSQDELKQLLANQFFEFGSSGRVLYKDVMIGEEGIGAVNMKLSDFDIHPLSEGIVLATYRIFNKEKNQHTLRSSIWKLIEGRWQMIFHQGTISNPL